MCCGRPSNRLNSCDRLSCVGVPSAATRKDRQTKLMLDMDGQGTMVKPHPLVKTAVEKLDLIAVGLDHCVTVPVFPKLGCSGVPTVSSCLLSATFRRSWLRGVSQCSTQLESCSAQSLCAIAFDTKSLSVRLCLNCRGV